MSIYIKDMKKPENCYACPCYNDEYGKCQIEGNWEKGYVYDTTPDWCPLIPVPDHGRLIDADALVHSYYHAPSFPNLCKAINDAPTIIPADQKEESE